MRSLRRRLLVWSLVIVLLGGLVSGVIVFQQARAQATELFDYQLRQLAFTLRDRDYSPSQLAEALSGEGLDFVIQVWAADSRLLYRSHPQIGIPGPGQPGFTDVETTLGTFMWDPMITEILNAPTWVVFGILGVVLFWLGRKRTPTEVFIN